MDAVRKDIKLTGVRDKDAMIRVKWKQMIYCGDQ